ncbi:Panacea domain-containing protein [Glacieibacterium megasporae]|uniref:Panacea domain-containing protein n=1 Tax=Glacieibacterium megasporae TaxID=2835787 RepID=UPI001C1DD682|nr:type II toxin-antitoxin system antitoxin SocA domain-containing protein [Polymorphobacter megasporae]UAJ09583.1 DUF4065 domain-containing protein [Polymorphobacter megasporae]
MNKIIYFLFEKMLVEEGRRIFSAKIEAWEHGPVVREIYSEFKKFGDAPIRSQAKKFSLVSRQLEIALDVIDNDDIDKFSAIVDHYLPMSASTLRRISHEPNSPWFSVWSHDGSSNPGMEISASIIEEAFYGYKVHS